MNLSDLVHVNRTPQEWRSWSFSNQDHHTTISDALFRQKGVAVSRYPLDPIPPERSSLTGAPGASWLYNHQGWHNEINGALGTQGVDLTAVDFSREDQAETWAWLHYREHLSWALKLGANP